jgi:myo-inositol-1(or 4)-monophosphatase
MDDLPEHASLAEYEALAAELAALAGAEVEAALGRALRVAYKGGSASTRDPVSEVDHAVEVLLRARIGERYPEHDIIGEEIDECPGRTHDHIWAVDPVDGTANFINGLPLFASSVGLVIRGRPVVGAIWCSTSHLLRPGVYSAHLNGTLKFAGMPLARPATAGIRRRLLGLPEPMPVKEAFDSRKTGSAAIECAFVAAGLLAGARFRTPNIWDVAGGIALVQAAGSEVRRHDGTGWSGFRGFAETAPEGDPSRWNEPLLIGDGAALAALAGGER